MYSMHNFITDDQNHLAYYKIQVHFASVPNVYADLSEITTGTKLGREPPEERIMTMNLGLAIEDVATTVYVYQEAKKVNVGRWLPL